MRIWHVEIREEVPVLLSSGVIEELTVLAETFDKVIQKIQKHLEAWDDAFIGKIEYIEEVDIE